MRVTLFLSSLHWRRPGAAEHQLDISVKPKATVWSASAGIASFPFLTSIALDHGYDDSTVPQVSFSRKVLFSHVSPVYRKSNSTCVRLGIWCVCAASLNCKKDLQLYFYLSRYGHRPWLSGALGFISEITQNDAPSILLHYISYRR